MFLILAGTLQYCLTLWELSEADELTRTVISVVSSILVALTNYLVKVWLIFASKMEGHITHTKENKSLMTKIAFFQFFNAGIFYTLANLLAVKFDTETSTSSSPTKSPSFC